jgi:N-acetylglutamate synthase-like GNAT family acetyltransferase
MSVNVVKLKSNESSTNELTFSGFIPGCLSALCGIQSEFYAREWGFSHIYESVIAGGVSEFLTRFDEDKDFVRLVLKNNQIVGGITIDHRDGKTAQLRWFIVSDELRGTGIGSKIFSEAMSFIKNNRIKHVYLTTFQGLDKARTFYESVGFKLTHEESASTWGKVVTEQRFDWYADEHAT